eukprot:scaffold2045_cov404-Prasinococcus_capsulatus_cf.AAC.80
MQWWMDGWTDALRSGSQPARCAHVGGGRGGGTDTSYSAHWPSRRTTLGVVWSASCPRRGPITGTCPDGTQVFDLVVLESGGQLSGLGTRDAPAA